MKCPLCNAATIVREVRDRDDNSVRRTRECFNEHRFNTEEMLYIPQVGRKPMSGHQWRARLINLDARDAKIVADIEKGFTRAVVAETYGVSQRTVQRVCWKEAKRRTAEKNKARRGKV